MKKITKRGYVICGCNNSTNVYFDINRIVYTNYKSCIDVLKKMAVARKDNVTLYVKKVFAKCVVRNGSNNLIIQHKKPTKIYMSDIIKFIGESSQRR